MPPGTTSPTTSDVTVTVTGNFFSPSTVIRERGVALDTRIVNETTREATIVGGFTGNPLITVYTPPTSITLNDGGESANAIRLLNVPKKDVVITADNTSKV